MNIHTLTADVGTNPMTFETGKLAKLADGAVTVRCGDTIVIVTAVSATKVKDGQDLFPLSVEYKEKASAAGRFPGGYFKREGRPTEKEILTCRMTDRPLRPLFPKGYFYDTQIVALLLSADGENDSDILAMNGASAALCVSDIPFAGPIGAVRVGRVNGEFVVNPTHAQRDDSDLDLVYVGNKTDVIMIEGAANELPEEEFIKALHFAQDAVAKLVAAQEELGQARRQGQARVHSHRSPRTTSSKSPTKSPATASKAPSTPLPKSSAARPSAPSRTKWKPPSRRKFPKPTDFEISQAFDYLQKKAFRISILDKKASAADGRGIDQLRQLYRRSRPCCPASTVPPSSPAAKPRPSPSPRWLRPTKRRTWTTTPVAKTRSASSCTTTSLRSPSVKPAASVVRTAAKSATARSPSAPSSRSSLPKEDFPYAIRVSAAK